MTSNVTGKIKILFAIHRFSVGGAEKFLIHHLREIDRKKYDVTVVTIFDEKKKEETSCADQTHIDHCFYARSTWDIRAFLQIFSFVRRENYDVVVTHLFIANLLTRLAAILAGTHTIISYEHNIYPNKRYWQIIADKILSLFTDTIIVDSDAAKTFTAKQEWIPLSKFLTIIIPPLLDNKERRTREQVLSDLGIPNDSLVVVTVSRLVIDKGHTYLVAAAPAVIAQHTNAYFLVGGWGPLKDDLEAQVQKLGVGAHVKLLGKVDGQEFLTLADVYVDPSISTDLPIGIMEAMREGKAIVATTVGEIPTFIQNEKTGLVVPPANPHALAEAISRMLEDGEMRKRYGAAAKEKCAEYSLENYMRTFDALIEDLRRV
ncbi:MAG: glycosyltransferase [bacterium]|nr:glycosyltransferase [bacterium]